MIVLFPEFANAGPIDRFRARWDLLAAEIPPHVTLVFPFTAELDTEALHTHVGRVCSEVSPFILRLSGVTGSEGEYLFLNVKRGNDEVVRLHDLLYTGPLAEHLRRDHTFVPHLTVGRVGQPGQLDAALSEAGPLNAVFEAVIQEVTAYVIEPNGARKVELRVPLGLRADTRS